MLRQLKPPSDDRLLVGATTGDDAAVWRLDDDRALIVTADFITPIVDDARTWGRIAAANAASDVYAMGGRPLLALNLVAWNKDELPIDLLADVLNGAGDVADDGGFVIAGGHTIDDPVPKFGLAVVGEAHPDRILTNAGLRPGQDLLLSKPLGIGIISTAVKRGVDLNSHARVDGSDADGDVLDLAVGSMTRLNKDAAAVASAAHATGATDITGFGLLGHLGRAAVESAVAVELQTESVPLFPGVRRLAEAGLVPGGSQRNLDAVRSRIEVASGRVIDEVDLLVLADAQTSGGLVFGVNPDQTASALASLLETGHDAAVVGRVLDPAADEGLAVGSIRLR